jgi:hypothetical protein
VDRPLATSVGLSDEALARLMSEIGFRSEGDSWKWRGNRPRRTKAQRPVRPDNAFVTALAGLKR